MKRSSSGLFHVRGPLHVKHLYELFGRRLVFTIVGGDGNYLQAPSAQPAFQ